MFIRSPTWWTEKTNSYKVPSYFPMKASSDLLSQHMCSGMHAYTHTHTGSSKHAGINSKTAQCLEHCCSCGAPGRCVVLPLLSQRPWRAAASTFLHSLRVPPCEAGGRPCQHQLPLSPTFLILFHLYLYQAKHCSKSSRPAWLI